MIERTNQRIRTASSLHLAAITATMTGLLLQTSMLPVCGEKASGRVHAAGSMWQKDQGWAHLIFPSNLVVGKLYLQTSGASREMTAMGAIDVPAGAHCRLDVNYRGAENLQWLSALPPQSVGDLNLSKLPVSDDGLKYVGHLSGLEKLDLSDTDISDQGLVHLRTLKGLKKLKLGSAMIKGSGLAFLSDLDSMQELTLRCNELGDSQLKYLPKLRNLIFLDVARCQLTNDGLAKLKDLPRLWQLEMGSNAALNDDGLKHLAGLTNLYALGIEETSVTVDCIRYLKRLPKLGIVTLSFKNFSQSDLTQMRRALPRCKVNNAQSHKGFPLEVLEPLH